MKKTKKAPKKKLTAKTTAPMREDEVLYTADEVAQVADKAGREGALATLIMLAIFIDQSKKTIPHFRWTGAL